MTRLKAVHRTAALLFVTLFALYLAMSPVTTGGRGYIGEEIDSGTRTMAIFNAWWKGRPVPQMIWARHGLVPVLFDIPFIKLGKFVVSPDFAMSLSPIFFTAALLTVLYLWLRKLTSPAMSLLLAMTGAFATMLWPYAYIGLETKQSFFVLLAGYLGLANGRIRTWPRLILFATVCGLAMTVKSTGIVLWPAFAFLIYAQFSGEWRARIRQLLACVVVTGCVWGVGEVTRRFYWTAYGGGYSHLKGWIIESPLHFFINVIGIFGSPTKGLLVFAPVLLACLYAVPLAFRRKRDVTLFALLATGCLLGFISLLIAPADEVWGPRYMHMTVAPLLLCIGAAWPSVNWKLYTAIIFLGVIGTCISFLGAFYYYGSRAGALFDGGQNTMEWLIGDPAWNEITFDARAFHVWLKGCPSTPWTPLHIWVWEAPPGAAPWKSVELQKFCQPQSILLREWGNPSEGILLKLFRACQVALVIGVLSLLVLIGRTIKETRSLRT